MELAARLFKVGHGSNTLKDAECLLQIAPGGFRILRLETERGAQDHRPAQFQGIRPLAVKSDSLLGPLEGPRRVTGAGCGCAQDAQGPNVLPYGAGTLSQQEVFARDLLRFLPVPQGEVNFAQEPLTNKSRAHGLRRLIDPGGVFKMAEGRGEILLPDLDKGRRGTGDGLMEHLVEGVSPSDRSLDKAQGFVQTSSIRQYLH